MRPAEEFAAWMAARWPTLVRTVVLLGHPQPEAEQVAREALARVLPSWARERKEGDVDLLVLRAALEEHERVLRHRDERATDQPLDDPELPPGLEGRLERRRELEQHLATLTEPERARTVLRHVAGLTDEEVDDVLGAAGATPPLPLSGPDVRDACEGVPVPPAPVAEVLTRSRNRRRTAWTRGAGVVAVVAGVLAATTWWTSGGGPEQGTVTPARNPLPVPWYADGRLHLARVDVEVAGLRTLLSVPDGVVYSDREGHVVHVDDGGVQRQIGETVPDSRLVVEPDNGWVAWADPGGGDPELVVHDTLGRTEVGRRPLSAPGGSGGDPVGEHGPIAIDDERVHYSSPDGDFAWEPLIDVSFALSGTMVDTAEEARVTRTGGVLRLTPVPYRTGAVVDADDARLTHDGRYAFAVRDSRLDELEAVDVEPGRPLPRMYSPSDEAVSWAYQRGTFYFAVLHKMYDKTYQDTLQMPSAGDYRIYSCRPFVPSACRKLAEVPEEVPDPPIFPQ